MPSIRYIHGRRPHIATGSVDSSSDDSHFIDYAHPASQHSKDLPTLFDQDIWQGDTDTDTYTQVAPFPSSPPSSASGASASGATLSSPVLEPRYKDIQDQRDSVRLWDLADKIFGDLLDSIDFPLIYDRHIRRHHITEQDWQETKTYLEQHTYIVHSLSFFYDPVMATLDIYSPTSLHQIVNDSMVNRYTESVQVKQHQAISIDGARGLITDNIGHTPDSVLSISTTRRLPDGDLIYVARDTGVTETSFTQSVDDMVGQRSTDPLLFTGINIDTEDFIEPDAEHAAPDSGGFIKGGGAANDVISTGWKRGDRVLIKRVKAQWFMFLPEEREDVARCLKEYHNARDWVVWKYGVHHYEAGSEAFIAHDHALRRYREAIIRIRAVAHNQRVLAILMEAEQTRDKSVLNELKESDVADDLTFDDPPIPDPIPSFIRDIQVGVRQKAQDDWSRHTYRVETNNAATLNDAEERSQYRRVMETLKRVLDDDVADGDEQALADFRKRQRFNTPSPPPPPKPRQPPRLKVEDFPEEELSSSEPSGSGSSAKSSFEQPRGMADANEYALATGHPSRVGLNHSLHAEQTWARLVGRLMKSVSCSLVSLRLKFALLTSKRNMAGSNAVNHSINAIEQCCLVQLLNNTPNLNQVLKNLLDRLQDVANVPTSVQTVDTGTSAVADQRQTRSETRRLRNQVLPENNADNEAVQQMSSQTSDTLGQGTVGPTRQTRSCQRKTPYAREEGNPAGRSSQRRNVLRRRSRSPCWRGGVPFCLQGAAPSLVWESDQQAAPSQSSKATVHKFFTNLTSNLTEQAIVDCCESMQHGISSTNANVPRFAGDESLKTLANDALSHSKTRQPLISSLRRADPDLTNTDIWRTELQTTTRVAKRTFLDWISQGSKFAFAAGGGSVYMLILIAVQNLRVPLGAVDGHSAQEIGNMLRWPDDSRAGHLVKEIIIPSISNLHRHYPTMLDDLFPVSTVRIGSLEENDAYFDGLKSNTFSLVPRLKSVWQSYGQGVLRAASPIQQPSRLSPLSQSLNPLSLSPLTPVMTLSQLSSQLSSPLSSQLSSPLSSPHWLPHSSPQSTFEATAPTPPIPVIITSYDPEKKNNLRYPAPRDKAQNIAWTETARSWARKAIVPLQETYKDGERISQDAFVRVPMNLISDALNIRGRDNGLIASICTSMPDAMKRNLMDGLVACFDSDPFKPIDSNSANGERTFEAIHFSWYNRHCTSSSLQGHSAPADIPPALLSRAGCMRTNHGQFVPYVSKDMEDHQAIYQSLKNIFADVFSWIDEKLQTVLPMEYERLEATASILPGNNVSVVNPFVGLVVNLNVVTRAHRDSKDDSVCLVLPIGDFSGDREMSKWTADDRNGWVSNDHFR
ncbi:uncharacterized protein B0H18DRAFT_963097 [Fomitopsis serialis]|uniref:uncharacterized protein n=1 Tax=Fomitopsis serialis TaxID=139415 RepID=UPI002007B217|nr:uncharacterized protein B0H18DRAFT_963097 [Neoantrodia serialis]KAH9910583.1 hypothetical protein B0H18DRAFT_963097 [Neoantrodia serialis]